MDRKEKRRKKQDLGDEKGVGTNHGFPHDAKKNGCIFEKNMALRGN